MIVLKLLIDLYKTSLWKPSIQYIYPFRPYSNFKSEANAGPVCAYLSSYILSMARNPILTKALVKINIQNIKTI